MPPFRLITQLRPAVRPRVRLLPRGGAALRWHRDGVRPGAASAAAVEHASGVGPVAAAVQDPSVVAWGHAVPDRGERSSCVPEIVQDAVSEHSPALTSEPARAPVPVPWRVVRRSPHALDVENVSQTVLHSVRFALAGDGLLGLSLPRAVLPGERLRVALGGEGDGRGGRRRGREHHSTLDTVGDPSHDAAAVLERAPDALLVLRWFEADGTELLWPIVL